MSELISVAEAARLVGRSKVNVYKWIRNGWLVAEVVMKPRNQVGKLAVDVDEVLRVSKFIGQGVRTDLGLGFERPYDFEDFEDWQLEVARRVYGKC